MNADAEAALQGLVDRAMTHMERTDRMNESATTDLLTIEATIRAADNAAHALLRKLRASVDDAQAKDIDAYAQALVDKQGAPKATAKDIRDKMKDLETRVIPATDEALWLLSRRAIDMLRPEAEERWLQRLRAQLQRWAPPKFISDPSNVLPAPRVNDPDFAERPDDVVEWVLHGIERIERFDAQHAEEEARKERQRVAKNAVDNAQAIDEREYYRRYEEEEKTSARKRHAPAPPYPGFNRFKWLQEHNLLDDYEYVQPGTVVQAKGSGAVQSAMGAPPAPIESCPEPELTSTPA